MESRKRQNGDLFYPEIKKRKKINIYPPIQQNHQVFWKTQNVAESRTDSELNKIQDLVRKMEIQLVYQNNQIQKLQHKLKNLEEKYSNNKKVKFKSQNCIAEDIEESISKMDLDESPSLKLNINKPNKNKMEEWSYIS